MYRLRLRFRYIRLRLANGTACHIATLLDKGSVVCAAFIDLRKAFDSLDHCLLLQRIYKLGVHYEVLE